MGDGGMYRLCDIRGSVEGIAWDALSEDAICNGNAADGGKDAHCGNDVATVSAATTLMVSVTMRHQD